LTGFLHITGTYYVVLLDSLQQKVTLVLLHDAILHAKQTFMLPLVQVHITAIKHIS